MRSIVYLCLILLSACASTPSTQYYTLLAPSVETEPLAIDKSSLGIGPIVLPARLESETGIVSIREGNQVDLSLYNVWAGDLKENISSVMADHLSQLTKIDKVWPYPWDNRHRPEHQIRLIIERFSGQLNNEVLLRAKWTWLDQAGRRERTTQSVNIRQPVEGPSYNDYVTALNRALNQLTLTIAQYLVASK